MLILYYVASEKMHSRVKWSFEVMSPTVFLQTSPVFLCCFCPLTMGWYIHPALLILSLILPYNRPNHLYFVMCPISFDGSVGGDCSKSTKSQQALACYCRSVWEELWLCVLVWPDMLEIFCSSWSLLTEESVWPCMSKKLPLLSTSKNHQDCKLKTFLYTHLSICLPTLNV